MMLLTFFLTAVLSLSLNDETRVEPRDPALLCPVTATSGCQCPPLIKDYPGAACLPEYQGKISELSTVYQTIMPNRSWHDGCPLPLTDLRLLTVSYFGFDGMVHDGQLVVAAGVAEEVNNIFKELYYLRFPIEKIHLIDYYEGDDNRSMADNNSSAFNCRRVTSGKSWSEHSYGWAIDINPLQNPYVTARGVEPLKGLDYLKRDQYQRGMILADDAVVKIFRKYGWKWGGNWKSVKDYQHFSKSGR